MANVNSYNFLRWQEDPSDKDLSLLPNYFIQDRCVFPYMPVLVPGDILSFYINTKDGLGFDNPETLQLVIFNENMSSAAMSVSIDDLDDVSYNIYATFAIPPLTDGIYRLKIVQGSAVLLVSNLVRVMTSGFEDSTSLVKFKNSTNHFGVRYGFLSNFYQQFRLHITEKDQNYEDDIERYMSVTTGQARNLQSNPQKLHEMECYYFDKEAHEAAAVMCNSDYIEFNGEQYVLKKSYEKEPLNIQGKSKGSFEMYNLAFATINKCG